MTSPFVLIGYWITAAAAIWLSTAALAFSPLQPLLFQRVYGGHMGHHVASQLSRAVDAGEPTCLLVGLSTTRAAFVPSILEAEVPGIRFIEVASAGGSIFGVELIVDMIRARRLSPKCIVLGMHSHLLKDRTLALWPAGFLDVMTPVQQVRFIPHEVAGERTRTLIEAARRGLWPATRMAEQTSALWRDTLHRSQWLLPWREPLTRSAFERAAGELMPFDAANPPLERAMTADQRPRFFADMIREHLLEPDTYAQPEHLTSLANVIAESLRLAPVVVVDVLPESRYGREQVSPLADGPFKNVLEQFSSPRLHVFDDRAMLADDQFDVAFHVLRSASEDYSRQFAKRLAPLVAAK